MNPTRLVMYIRSPRYFWFNSVGHNSIQSPFDHSLLADSSEVILQLSWPSGEGTEPRRVHSTLAKLLPAMRCRLSHPIYSTVTP